jgi:hypothetical protein
LVACHCYRQNDEVIRIISARKADAGEIKQYREDAHDEVGMRDTCVKALSRHTSRPRLSSQVLLELTVPSVAESDARRSTMQLLTVRLGLPIEVQSTAVCRLM